MFLIKYYNFYKKCKDYFATTQTIGQNRVVFITTFLKNKALYYLCQYQRKIENITKVLSNKKNLKSSFVIVLKNHKLFQTLSENKIRKASQYQLEEIIDQTTYFEHLQSILKKINFITIPNKEILIQYFCNKLRLLFSHS